MMRGVRLSFVSGLLSLAAAAFTAIRDAPLRIYCVARDFVLLAFDLFRPEPLDFSRDGWSELAHVGGAPLDSALQNAMRHEAHQHQRGAVRHT